MLNTSGELSIPGSAAFGKGAEDRLNSAEKHRLLVHANPFNVCIIFRPFIAFVSTAKQAIPSSILEGPEIYGTFLNDFITKVYLPRLEEKGTSLFQVAVNGKFESTPLHQSVLADRRNYAIRSGRFRGRPPFWRTVTISGGQGKYFSKEIGN